MKGKLRIILFLAGVMALVGAGFIFDLGSLVLEGLGWIAGLGWIGRVLYIVLYITATVAFIPGSIITLAGGFLFGLGWGTAFVSIGSTLGAALAFLLGRFLMRAWVSGKIQGNARFEAIDRAVAQEGWKIVFLTRLSPVFPFNIQNYAYGLTKVSFVPYVLSSWIGMLPGTLMYVYFGSLTGDFTQLATGMTAGQAAAGETIPWVRPLMNVLGLAATVGVTLVITRIARKALSKHMVGDREKD